jgi:general secretion pathway protein G
LELLVVIAVLGLLSGLALPRFYQMFASASFAFEKDSVINTIAKLGYQQYKHSQHFVLSRYPLEDKQKTPFELPDGWTLNAEAPIHYLANGVCLGGRLRLTTNMHSMTLMLHPPLCRPQLQ